MIRQLGKPDAFLTSLASKFHWDRLVGVLKRLQTHPAGDRCFAELGPGRLGQRRSRHLHNRLREDLLPNSQNSQRPSHLAAPAALRGRLQLDYYRRSSFNNVEARTRTFCCGRTMVLESKCLPICLQQLR